MIFYFINLIFMGYRAMINDSFPVDLLVDGNKQMFLRIFFFKNSYFWNHQKSHCLLLCKVYNNHNSK